jgi:TPR repeat protein
MRASSQGYGRGSFNVGYCFLNGIGTEKDESKAVIFFEKAKEEGALGWDGFAWQRIPGRDKEVLKSVYEFWIRMGLEERKEESKGVTFIMRDDSHEGI